MGKEIFHSKPTILPGHVDAVAATLQSGNIAEGSFVQKFSEELSSMFNSKEVLLTNTGSSAIMLALKLLDVGTADEVVLPTYVCSDVFNVVLAVGAIPVLCDIGENWNTNKDCIKNQITKSTKAIIFPHNLGIQANIEEVKTLGIPIVEDCCLCLGQSLSGKIAGTVGDLAILSFQATKCITTGEGGAIIFNNEKWKSNRLINQFAHILRMSDLQACLGVKQLASYNDFLDRRKQLANAFFEKLPQELTAKFRESHNSSVFFRFLITAEFEFENFKTYMYHHKVHIRKGIDDLLHRKYDCGADEGFPCAVKTFNTTISLPLYPSLSVEDVYKIAELVNNY